MSIKRSKANTMNHTITLADTNLNSGSDGVTNDARRAPPRSKTHRRDLSTGVELEESDSVRHWQRFGGYEFKITGFGLTHTSFLNCVGEK